MTSDVSEPGTIRIGARRSPLAVAQAEWVAGQLQLRGVRTEVVGITTQGDVDRRELTQIGGTGVFASAVRDALQADTIDLAVHSGKDLPTAPVPGLEVVAHPEREDPRDVLIGLRLADLDGARVGTGSPRRASQLQAWARARGIEITVQPIRGNVDRRISLVRSGEIDATLLAAAGLRRLGRLSGTGQELQVIDAAGVPQCPAELLDPEVMLPAAAQGALAVEAVAGSPAAELAAALDHQPTRARVIAERSLLARLEAGCTAPVGALAELDRGRDIASDLTMAAVIGRTYPSTFDETAAEGSLIRVVGSGSADEAAALGARLAEDLLARLDRT